MKLNPVQTDRSRYYSSEEFAKTAQQLYGLSKGQVNGFIVYAKGLNKSYLRSEKDFIPILKKYLGK